MKHKQFFFGVLAALIALCLWHGGPKRAALAATAGQRTPVLVELFTSEGCSSCPPADSVLAALERDQPVAGAQIIALGQHVDYWNNGSWTDRFSSHAFSLRQNDYAGHFHNDAVYTPQMIVDGQTEFVGSDKNRALQAIARAAQTPKANVQISPLNAAMPSGNARASVPLQVNVGPIAALPRGEKAEVMLAVTEDDLQSVVRGGENSGRTLSHSAVVRQLRLIGTATPGSTFTASPTLTLAPDWNQSHLQAIVFVQAQNSRRILGAATLTLRAEKTSGG